MTIATGIICQDGLLLAADSKFSGGGQTILGTKLFAESLSFGSVAFTFAGHMAFAQATISKALHVLKIKQAKITTTEDVADEIQKILEKEYNAHVYRHPDRASQQFEYDLIVGVRTNVDQAPRLFSSLCTCLRPSSDKFESVGTGNALFNYLTRRNELRQDKTLEEMLVQVVTAMGSVKGYVEGCGGNTEAIAIRNDGTLTSGKRFDLFSTEKYGMAFHRDSQRLFDAFSNYAVSENEFEALLGIFESDVRKLRAAWQVDAEVEDLLNPQL